MESLLGVMLCGFGLAAVIGGIYIAFAAIRHAQISRQDGLED